MRAFVIKNKKGKYLSFSPIEFNKDIRDAAIFKNTDLSQYCNNTSVILKDTKFVPITIYEGDPLELACEELKCRDENKTHAKLVIQQIKNKWLGENVDYKDWFIQQAKESKDE